MTKKKKKVLVSIKTKDFYFRGKNEYVEICF